jgi:ABC-type branched-subunit amino acid transport system substrate-binding protein
VIQSEVPRLGAALQGMAMTQVLPDAASQKNQAVRRFQAALAAADLSAHLGSSAFEGWVNAQVLIEGLRRAGNDLRRERLRDALAGLNRLDLGDLPLGYGEQAPYVASQFVELAVLGAGGRRLG